MLGQVGEQPRKWGAGGRGNGRILQEGGGQPMLSTPGFTVADRRGLLRVAVLVFRHATGAADAVRHAGIGKRLGLVTAFAALDRVRARLHRLFDVAARVRVTILGTRFRICACMRIGHRHTSGWMGAGSVEGPLGSG
ncbi:hypothetical protein SPHINGO391_400019 [Sphingomonas aurantiaca]|uniref:Uncharacterized protein n=1 Tax=Sphingomonas aurantiaca TaxID=185949 RepID=A0A5E7YZT9_9SPHN|nr:hypothetical protein SPHINGO391_400019 [Sphingomonas aurantiaca]